MTKEIKIEKVEVEYSVCSCGFKSKDDCEGWNSDFDKFDIRIKAGDYISDFTTDFVCPQCYQKAKAAAIDWLQKLCLPEMFRNTNN